MCPTPRGPWIAAERWRRMGTARLGAIHTFRGESVEETIRVQRMQDGRVTAKIEPLGPVVHAESIDGAVELVKRAHRAYLRQQTRWLPPGVGPEVVRYAVVGVPG